MSSSDLRLAALSEAAGVELDERIFSSVCY